MTTIREALEALVGPKNEFDNIRWYDVLACMSDHDLRDWTRKYLRYVRQDMDRARAALAAASPEPVATVTTRTGWYGTGGNDPAARATPPLTVEALAKAIHAAICPQLGRPCSGGHATADAAAILAALEAQR